MRTILKPLPQRYVHTYSDIYYGLCGRNDAVDALKTLVLGIKDLELLKEIDQLKPSRTPQQSFITLIEWLQKKHEGMYFKAEKGKFNLGTTNSGLYEIHMFAMDFLPMIRERSIKMENLLLNAMYRFINYHGIADPIFGGRCYNLEFSISGIEEEAEELLDEAQKTFIRDIRYMYKYYEKKLKKLNYHTWSGHEIANKLSKMDYPPEMDDVADLILDYVDMCSYKSISSYAEDAMAEFCERNDIPQSADGAYEFSDGEPVQLNDLVAFTWTGEDKEGELSYEQHDYKYSVDDYAGHFGSCEYSIDVELTPDISVSNLLKMNNKDAELFNGLSALLNKHQAIRDKYYFDEKP